jgi:signal transduction histidine kinase
VAHDVNNVFTAIGLVGLALERRDGEDLRAHGSSLRNAVELGGRLIEQLSLFGGEGGAAARVGVDLAALIQRMRPLLVELMRGTRREIDLRAEAPVVVASPSELEQVVLNLCVNAAEAIASDAGTVRITLRDPAPDEPINPAALVLTVQDDGAGMDAETLAHVFEPYFTRKAAAGGGERGIGLSVVYGIVKRCHGTVSAASTPGGGTTFTVVLPRGRGPATTW